MYNEDKILQECGVYKDILFIAVPGYFATDAWIVSDEQYNKILGRKFVGITADDGIECLLDRYYIKRVRSLDDVKLLLKSACELFKKEFDKRYKIDGKED